MEDYQERVIAEKNELAGRLSKLRAFNRSVGYTTLSYAERGRLTRQEIAMGTYLEILEERIQAFRYGV